MSLLRRPLTRPVAVGGLALAFAWFGYSQSELVAASNRLEAVREKARAAGIPLSLQDMPPLRIPRSKRALPLLERASNEMHLVGTPSPDPLQEPYRLYGLENVPVSTRKQISAELLKLKDALDALDLATRRPHLGAEPARDPLNVDHPLWLEAVRLSSALGIRAGLKIRQGDADAAFRDLTTVSRGAALMRTDHRFISHLVATLLEDQVMNDLEDVMAKCGPSADCARRGVGVLDTLGPASDIRTALREEVALSISSPYWWDRTKPTGGPADLRSPVLKLGVVRRANETHGIEYWLDVYRGIDATGTNYEAAATHWEAVNRKWQRRTGWGYMLSTKAMPLYASSLRDMGTKLKRRQGLRTAMIAQLRRAELGEKRAAKE